MRTRMLLGGVAGLLVLLARPCPGQERTLPDPQVAPAAPAKGQPAPSPAKASATPDGQPVPAACDRPCPMTVRWVERQEPIQVLVPREVVAPLPRKTVVVLYREEKRTVTNMVLRPREVKREECCTTLKPVAVTDPHTGQCTTVLQPVPETRVVRDTVYEAVAVKQVLVVRVPYLREIEEPVPQRTIVLEYQTELKKTGYPVRVPGGEVLKDRWFLAPKPPHEGEPPAPEKPVPEKPAAERPAELVPPPRPETP